MRFVVLSVVLSASACTDTCEKPERTKYACAPLQDAEQGCVGGPVWFEDGDRHQDDVEKSFPVGCVAEIPDCSVNYEGSVRSFSCSGGLMKTWLELD